METVSVGIGAVTGYPKQDILVFEYSSSSFLEDSLTHTSIDVFDMSLIVFLEAGQNHCHSTYGLSGLNHRLMLSTVVFPISSPLDLFQRPSSCLTSPF